MVRPWYGEGAEKVGFILHLPVSRPDVIGNFESPKFGKVDSPIINNLMKVYSVVLFFFIIKDCFSVFHPSTGAG